MEFILGVSTLIQPSFQKKKKQTKATTTTQQAVIPPDFYPAYRRVKARTDGPYMPVRTYTVPYGPRHAFTRLYAGLKSGGNNNQFEKEKKRMTFLT